jgi:predicted phosphodiesterase
MLEFTEDSYAASEIDCIINNGDVATPNYVLTRQQALNVYDTYYATVKKSVVPYIQVVGNHDKHQESNVPYVDALTNSEVQDYLRLNTYHTASTLYQVYDYEDKKIRIIKLDGFDYPLEENADGKVKYPLDRYDCFITQTQLEWFVGNLFATPSEYDVIVCGHIHKDSVVCAGLIEILAAFNNQTSGTTTIDYSGSELEMPVSSVTVSYNFSSLDNNKIVAFMLGHNHRDSMQVVSGINVIGTACQYLSNDFGTGAYSSRFAYTENQNCFNMLSVDTINKKLYINRFGYNPEVYTNDVLDY